MPGNSTAVRIPELTDVDRRVCARRADDLITAMANTPPTGGRVPAGAAPGR